MDAPSTARAGFPNYLIGLCVPDNRKIEGGWAVRTFIRACRGGWGTAGLARSRAGWILGSSEPFAVIAHDGRASFDSGRRVECSIRLRFIGLWAPRCREVDG